MLQCLVGEGTMKISWGKQWEEASFGPHKVEEDDSVGESNLRNTKILGTTIV